MKIPKQFLLLLSLILFLLPATAQQGIFSGRISDNENSESLVGASVYVRNDMSIGVVTDFNGYFTVSVEPGEYRFTISFTGMKTINIPVTVKADSNTYLEIKMEPFSVQFDEVIIRAGKFDKTLEDQTASIEIMTPRIIDAKNTRNVETILDLTPGVTILDSEPQIRGGSGFTFGVGSKVAVFIDDLPMMTGDAGKPDWSLIPVENIKQIEVVKGASSVLSGSAALSGAIYIRTNYPGTKPVTKVRSYVGMYTPPSSPAAQWWSGINYIGGISFLHTRQLGEGYTDLVLGGTVMTDRSYIGAPVPGPNVVSPGDSISDHDMINKKARLNFSLRRRSKAIKGLNFGLNGNIMFNASSSPLAWLDDTANFYRAYPGAVLLSDALTMYFDPYVNFYSNMGMKHQFTNRILYNNVEAIQNQSNRVLMVYNNYQFSKNFKNFANLDLIAGVASTYTKSHAELYAASGSADNYIWNASAFIEVEKKFGNAVNVSAGARLEHFRLNDSIQDTKPIFRIGTAIKLGQETYMRASIGQGYRFPTITERYIRTKVGAIGIFNNSNLIPEYSWNGEIGLKQGFKFSGFYGYFDVALFYQEYENTIEYLFGFWEPPPYEFALAGFKFVNTGKSQVTGIDMSLTGQAKFGQFYQLNILLGYTYTKPKTLEPNYVFATDYSPTGAKDFSYTTTSVDPSQGILKYRFLHMIKSDIEFKVKLFAFGFTMKYLSKIENLDQAIFDFEDVTTQSGGSFQPILYRNYFETRNNGNFIFDVRLSYTFLEHHKIAVISDNVFNRMYSLRPLKAEPIRSVTLQYSLDL